MAYHPFRDWWLKGLALALAVLLWLSVSFGEPIVERGLEIPLEFENVPAGLEVVGDPPDSVSVRVRGPSSVVGRLDPRAVVARLDLSGERAGRQLYDMFANRVEVPPGLEVISVIPASVTLELGPSGISRTAPIVPNIEGQPPAGFLVGRIITVPSSVEVIGPESRLRELREALTEPISVLDATGDILAEVTVGVGDPALRLTEPLTARVRVELVPAPVERVVHDVPVIARDATGAIRAWIEPDRIVVTVRGASDTLSGLGPGSVQAYVDVGVLAELPPGRYNLPVSIHSPDHFRITHVDPSSVMVGLR